MYFLCFSAVHAEWEEYKRGSWITSDSGFTIATPNGVCDLVVGDNPSGPVSVAAELLAKDIEDITGQRPDIVSRAKGQSPAIVFNELSNTSSRGNPELAWLQDEYEAFQIDITPSRITLSGSDKRGTAFAAYELSERIGIDPLYIWTGYTPDKHATLRVKPVTYKADSPAFRFRGFFHDDEDILPRPMHPKVDFPDPNGTIEDVWYERYFETAMRLRQNMVAPYTRTQRHQRIYEMANRYGLYVTTHHYDVLMSNVWGFKRHGLAEKIGVEPVWNYQTNAEGLQKYWRHAVEKLKGMDVIWSIGMRADGDTGYKWPEGTTDADKKATYDEVQKVQMDIVNDIMGPGQEFAFTAWGEMNRYYQKGLVETPEDVITVWADKVPAGYMKALPEPGTPGRHGIYYHLSILTSTNRAIQNASVVSPELIADQFSNIFKAGATEYLLTNISEIREFCREGLMLAQLSVIGGSLLEQEDPAKAFREWFSVEYFGEKVAPLVDKAYAGYYEIIQDARDLYVGNSACLKALDAIEAQLADEPDNKYNPIKANEKLDPVIDQCDALLDVMAEAKTMMSAEQARFFEENCELPLLMLSQPANAAYILNRALERKDNLQDALHAAAQELQVLEDALVAAERPPFERWYGYTWPKHSFRDTDPRQALQRIQKMIQ